jgi:hypothetical protein
LISVNSSKIEPNAMPLRLMMVKVRETTFPASSRDGNTPNALGATAKLKKHAAPSHKPIKSALIFTMNFILFEAQKHFLLCSFSEKRAKASAHYQLK